MLKKYLNLPKKKKKKILSHFFLNLALNLAIDFYFYYYFVSMCVLCVCVRGRYRYMFMCENNHARRCTHLHRRKPEESIICPTVSSSRCSFQAGSLTEIEASVL